MRKIVSIIIIALVFTPHISLIDSFPKTLRVVGNAWILAPAVSRTASGYVGVTVNISVIVTEGWGDVYVSTFSLTEKDFQGAATIAARVASEFLGLDYRKYNFYFRVDSDAVIIGGPSAGVAMATVVFSALSNLPINRTIMVTGMIAPDGSVGPVGGVFEKTEAVYRSGGKVFLVPPGQTVVTRIVTRKRKIGPFEIVYPEYTKINLTEYAMREWGIIIKEVIDISEVFYYFFGIKRHETIEKSPEISDIIKEYLFSISSRLGNEAKSRYRDVTDKIIRSQIPNSTKTHLLWLLKDNSEKYITSGDKIVDPYISASYYFRALVGSEWVYLLLKYYERRDFEDYIKEVEGEISTGFEEIKEEWSNVDNPLDLNFILIATDRLLESEEKLLNAKKIWKSDTASALYDIAYAKWRASTAKTWLELTEISKGEKLELAPPRREAQTYILEARNVWSYVETIASETGMRNWLLDAARDSYILATEKFSVGDYISACVAAMKSIAYSEAVMDILQTTVSGEKVYIRYSEKKALLAISSLSNVTDPVISYLYYNLALREEKLENKLVLIKLSSYYARLILDLLPEDIPKETTAALPKILNTSKPAPQSKHNATNENNSKDIIPLPPPEKYAEYVLYVTLFLVIIVATILIILVRRGITRI